MPAPLVMLSRVDGATGWSVQVSEEQRPALVGAGLPSGLHLEPGVDGTLLLRVPRGLALECESDSGLHRPVGGKIELPQRTPIWFRSVGGAAQVVLFREEDQARAPSAAVMKAISAVRANDTEETRGVLQDVLEESGALAEAEYVRREQRSLSRRDYDLVRELRELRALGSVVGQTFRYLVGRDVDGCAGLRWTLRCPLSFNELDEGPSNDERLCRTCRQLVVRAADEQHAAELARRGVCVSLAVDEEPFVGEIAGDD